MLFNKPACYTEQYTTCISPTGEHEQCHLVCSKKLAMQWWRWVLNMHIMPTECETLMHHSSHISSISCRAMTTVTCRSTSCMSTNGSQSSVAWAPNSPLPGCKPATVGYNRLLYQRIQQGDKHVSQKLSVYHNVLSLSYFLQ